MARSPKLDVSTPLERSVLRTKLGAPKLHSEHILRPTLLKLLTACAKTIDPIAGRKHYGLGS